MRNTFLLIISFFLLTACGELSMNVVTPETPPTEDTPPISVENFLDPVAVDSSRMVNQSGNELDIYSFQYNSTNPSGVFYESKLLPPIENNIRLQPSSIQSQNNLAFISYKSYNHNQKGALDILDITDKRSISLKYSYESKSYELIDLKIKNGYLFILANKLDQQSSSLVLVDLSNKNEPKTIFKHDFSGKSNNLELIEDTILVSTESSNFEFNTSNINNVQLSTQDNNSNYQGVFSKIYKVILKSINNTVLSVLLPQSITQTITVNNQQEFKSRLIRQNSLIYLNNGNNSLSVLDISQTLKNQSIENLFQINLNGESNNISFNQQKLYLAQGDEGAQVVSITTPDNLEVNGKLVFNNQNEYIDNSWVVEKDNYKYIFLNDQENGILITSEDFSYASSDKIYIYGRGQNNLSNPAEVLVRVNGVNYQKLNLDNVNNGLFTITYTQPLTANDTVEVILLSPLEDQSAFISYVNVNGRFCYQQYTDTKDNTGLLSNLQTIKATQTTCETTVVTPLCQAGVVKSPVDECLLSNNRLGHLTCDSSSMDYFCKDVGLCQNGFTLENNICVPVICQANSTSDCSDSVSNRTQTCSSTGTSYGVCTFNSCKANFSLVNGQCEPEICVSGTPASCSISNGSGLKLCNSSGTDYGSCVLTSCDSGFYNNNGVCSPQVCTPNATDTCITASHFTGTKICDSLGSSFSACSPSVNTCASGYTFNAGSCDPQSCTPNSISACSAPHGTGQQTCASDGLSYGACIVNSCDSSYTLVSGVCVAQICSPNSSTSCSISNGLGTKTCSSDGLSYGSCSTTSCNSGYILDGGICVEQICSPNSSVVCSDSNGTGTKLCNSLGTVFGSCQINSCNNGYYLNNGTCVAQTCSPNSTQSCLSNHFIGTQTCNSQGSSYGSCNVGTTCEAGYYNNNGVCSPQVCVPNSQSACSITNGSGLQTCNSTGSTYGSCLVSSCSAGFYQNGNSCSVQLCVPATTASCSIVNGTGSQTCDALGSSYGSCTITSCNAGYHLEGGACQSDTRACSISHGSGVQTWNGVAYGSCQPLSCNSGYYSNGSSCVAQTCTPNATSSCSISNGSGTRTCDSQGAGYGSCSANSCNSGYHVENNTCESNTRTCAITNGSGTQTWSGSSYGTCTVSSCSSDAYQSGNTCVLYCPNPLLIHTVVLGVHVCL